MSYRTNPLNVFTLGDTHVIDDRRTIEAQPLGYVICTDSLLSGWASVNRSLYALAFHSALECEALLIAARGRSEMKRPRVVSRLKANGQPRIDLRPGDHLAIVDRGGAGEWYKGASARWNCSD